MGREGVNLRDAGHKGHNGGTDRTTGTNQVAVFQGVLHQPLGGHINHVIVTGDDVVQLRLYALDEGFRGIVSVKSVELAVDQTLQIFHGVFDLGSKQVVGHGADIFAHIRNEIGIGDDNFPGLFLTQIAEFFQHIVGGAEVQGHGLVRIVKALGGQQDMAEHLVLGIQEVNVTGGNHHFAQLLAQADDFAVEVPKVLVGFGFVLFVVQHETVVGQGLDFQEVIERSDTLQLIVTLVIQNCLEQLARFTGRADDETLPQLHQLRLGDSGNPAEVLQIGIGDQMIEVAQALLILGKEDDMPGLPVGDAAAGAELHHGRIDGLQIVNIVLLFQFLTEPVHDQTAGHGIVPCPVMGEVRQTQGIGHDVQLEFIQVGQQILRKDQGIRRRQIIFIAEAVAFTPDEAGVKVGVVGNQNPVPHEFQELGQHFLDFGCTLQHLIGDAGEFHDFPVQRPLRVHEGLEPVHLFSLFEDDGTDLDDPVGTGRKARGFQVEGHIFLVEGHILRAMNHDAVVHVIDIVAFAAVEDLDSLVGAGHLGSTLPVFHHMQRIRKGLAAAVVGDGDGLVSPGGSLLDGGLGAGEGIHVRHGGMQVQLHPLFAHGQILPLGHGAGGHGKGLHDHFVFKPVLHEPSLYTKDAANLHILQNGLRLPRFHKAADADGVGIVGHVKLDDPGIALFQLLVVHIEDQALHDDGAHVHGHLVHGNRIALEGLAVEGIGGSGSLGFCLLLFRNGGSRLDHGTPHGFHGFKEGLALQGLTRFDGDGHGSCKPLAQHILHRRKQFFQFLFAVGTELYRQSGILPFPFGTCQGTTAHGIAADKEVHQLLRFNFM